MNNIKNTFYRLCFFVLSVILINCVEKNTSTLANTGPQRIISLSPHITEILFTLDCEESIIAVTDFCTYPPQAKAKTSIGGLLNPNLEIILALQPDVLIGSPAHSELAIKFQDKNMKFVLLPDRTLQDIYQTIDSIGIILHIEQKAVQLNKSIRDSLTKYHNIKPEIKEIPRAVFLFGGDSGPAQALSAIGPGSFTDDLWREIGGQNALADLHTSFAQINREAFINANPDIIIEFRPDLPEKSGIEKASLEDWSEFMHLKAYKHNQIYRIPGQYALIPGPRIIKLSRAYLEILNLYQHKNDAVK
ncbi:MAG: ABC transporter substrate-binding protein [Calditrichaceae bacterium]|nr:ABC transporter substrate-binding protein [Calditrichaceae bacterium]MBN2709253.1 ABC transporter substrate-binding protein [Calditrichaceae bacterium]